MEHAVLRSRGYLPHYDEAGACQHVVFRLADALPPGEASSLEGLPATERLARAEAALDSGLGSRALADPRLAALAEGALTHFNGRRYALLAWCVMPTHVHTLLVQAGGWPLSSVVQAWKSFTAHHVNARLGRTGRFWAPDYFDRSMRDEGQAGVVQAYIENNPVAAGLCAAPQLWPWSSARIGRPT